MKRRDGKGVMKRRKKETEGMCDVKRGCKKWNKEKENEVYKGGNYEG